MATTRPEKIAAALRLTMTSKPLWLEISGVSMGRTIRPGSEVLVVAAGRPRVGQVWVFCNDAGSVVVHRYRGQRSGRFVFEGDSAGHADRPVETSRLVGKVAAVRRGSHVRRLGRVEALIGASALVARRCVRLVRRTVGR